jgi:hypothetical protein
VHTVAGEALTESQPDTAGAAGHDGDLVREIHAAYLVAWG